MARVTQRLPHHTTIRLRSLTGNKEHASVPCTEENGIGISIGATTIRRPPTQATIGLHRTQGTPATIRRLPTQATIRPQPTPIPPQNTMATIAKQINAAATGHSLRMEFVYRRTRVSWTHAARNARNGDGHAKHLAQQTERTATFKNNMAHEQIEFAKSCTVYQNDGGIPRVVLQEWTLSIKKKEEFNFCNLNKLIIIRF